MSRPTASGDPPTTSPRSATSQAASQQLPPQHYPTNAASHGDTDRRFNAAPPIADARPYEQRTSPSTAQSTPVRGLGVQSILNPSAESIQVSAHESIPQARLPPPAVSPRGRKRPDPTSPSRASAYPTTLSGPRRVLTPKSPGLRAASLGAQRLPSIQTAAGISGHHLSGPEPRIYTAEPGSADVPTLPPLSATHRAFAPIPSLEASKPLVGQGPGPAHGIPPITPAPPHETAYSRPSPNPSVQTSPPFQYGQAPPSQNAPPSYRPQTNTGGFRNDLGPRAAEAYHSGPASYQMTLETEQGPMVVPVELDLLQASKVADEKRKRNAGASARFRARRKEKEKEASHTISSLQQDLRDLRAERDFYRDERNFIRDFASRHVQLPPRPPSPISRVQIPGPPGPDSPGYEDDTGRPRSDSAPAAQRRRTGEYRPAFSPPQPEPAQGYSTGYPPPPALPLPPPAGSGPYASPRSLPPAPTGHAPPGARSQSSYDPFRRDPFDRAWDTGR
jgi:hypothetical protein